MTRAKCRALASGSGNTAINVAAAEGLADSVVPASSSAQGFTKISTFCRSVKKCATFDERTGTAGQHHQKTNGGRNSSKLRARQQRSCSAHLDHLRYSRKHPVVVFERLTEQGGPQRPPPPSLPFDWADGERGNFSRCRAWRAEHMFRTTPITNRRRPLRGVRMEFNRSHARRATLRGILC